VNYRPLRPGIGKEDVLSTAAERVEFGVYDASERRERMRAHARRVLSSVGRRR
jgi:hypothetical protein